MKIYQEIIKVRGYELDSLGHVNQANYLLYAESVRWNHFASLGVTSQKFAEWGVGPVVLSQNIFYFKELRMGEEVRITSELLSFEGKKGSIHQIFYKGDIKAAELTITFTFINLKERRSCLPPDEMLALMKEV